MSNTTDIFVIILCVVNIIVSGLIIYSSVKINGDKTTYQTINTNNTNITNTSLDNIQEDFILYEQIFSANNTNNSTRNETIEKTESFLSTTNQPLFFLGISSICFIFLLMFSFCAKDNDLHCDETCSKGSQDEARCCCGACTCCGCYYCCRRCCRGGCSGSSGCTGCNCSGSDCNCSGADEGVAYVIIIALFLLIFILLFLVARALGKIISRIVGLISLFLFDIIFVCLGIIQGKEDGMNTFCYLVIISGIISAICNLLALITPCLRIRSINVYEPSYHNGLI